MTAPSRTVPRQSPQRTSQPARTFPLAAPRVDRHAPGAEHRQTIAHSCGFPSPSETSPGRGDRFHAVHERHPRRRPIRPTPWRLCGFASPAFPRRKTEGISREASKPQRGGTDGRESNSSERASLHDTGKAPPSAPTGQPKTAQGEALRFGVHNQNPPKPCKGDTPGPNQPRIPTMILFA